MKNFVQMFLAAVLAMVSMAASANRGEVAQTFEQCSISLASSTPDKGWFGLIVGEGCPYDQVATWGETGETHTPITKGFVTWLNGQDIAKEGFNLFYITVSNGQEYRVWMDIPFFSTTEGKGKAVPPSSIVFTGIEFILKTGNNAVAVPRNYR